MGMDSKSKKRSLDDAVLSTPKRAATSSSRVISPLVSPHPSRPVEKWTADVSLTENTDVLKKIAQSITEIPASGYISAQDKYFTNHTIIDALVAAKNRGVRVECWVGSGAKENKLQKLKRAGIPIQEIKDLHTKRYIMSEKDMEAAGNGTNPGKCTIYVGSHNNSYVAPNHYEDMVSYHDQEAFIKAYWEQQLQGAADDDADTTTKKAPLFKTPGKRSMTSTRDVDSNQSKAERILTLNTSSNASDMLDITSLTFNEESIVNAVQEVKKSRPSLPIRCIFDRLALTNGHLLDRLQEAGAQVHIYNPDAAEKVFGKFPALQHRKTILRRLNGDPLTVVSTGNLTSNSNNELNHDSWHPMDPKMFDTYKNAHDELIKECESYEDIKARKKLDF